MSTGPGRIGPAADVLTNQYWQSGLVGPGSRNMPVLQTRWQQFLNKQVPSLMHLQTSNGNQNQKVSSLKTHKSSKQEILTGPEQLGPAANALENQNWQAKPGSPKPRKKRALSHLDSESVIQESLITKDYHSY